MHPTPALLAATLGGALAGPPPADAVMPVIINGEVENGLSAVISIGTDALGDPISFCTASVIAPRVVLTAAHCTEFIPVELLTIAGRAFFGTDINAPTHTLNFEAVYLHPAYVELANGGEQLPEYDLSVLILAEDAPVQPMWWRTEAVTDADVGSPLLSVGFGLDERNRSGVKRSAPLQLDGYDEQFVIVRNASNAAGANICSGDSGGPQLIWDEQVDDWRQLAVHSWGDTDCARRSGSTRTDIAADWVRGIVQATHGTADQCMLLGYHTNGLCDDFCGEVGMADPECATADTGGPPVQDAELKTTCSSVSSATGLAVLLMPLMGAALRRESPNVDRT